MDSNVSSFDSAFALLDCLRALSSAPPRSDDGGCRSLDANGATFGSHVAEIRGEDKVRDRIVLRMQQLRSEEDIVQPQLVCPLAPESVDSLAVHIAMSRLKLRQVFSSAAEGLVVDTADASQTILHGSRGTFPVSRERADEIRPDISSRSAFSSDLQAAIDARVLEVERECEERLIAMVSAAREEGFAQGKLEGSREFSSKVMSLTAELERKEGDLRVKQKQLQTATANYGILDSKMAALRAQIGVRHGHNSHTLDLSSGDDELATLRQERDFYFRLCFQPKDDIINTMGQVSIVEHQRQQQLQSQAKDAELILMQRSVVDAERRLDGSMLKIAKLNKKLRFLQNALERSCSQSLQGFDTLPKVSAAVSVSAAVQEPSRGVSISEIVADLMTSQQDRSGPRSQIISLLVDWLRTYSSHSANRNVDGLVASLRTLCQNDASPDCDVQKGGSSQADHSAALQCAFDSVVHLREIAHGAQNAQRRFLGRVKHFVLPSRVSRSFPKPSSRSLWGGSSSATCQGIMDAVEDAEVALLSCIHTLASLEVRPEENKSAEVDDASGLSAEQRRRRWLMLKSSAMLDEAVEQGGQGPQTMSAGPQGRVAIVFTDIQSSTLLWQLFSEKMSEALKAHNQILREAIQVHSGFEVKTIGDAFMIAFSSPQSAVNYCMQIQDSLMRFTWDSVFNTAVEPTMTRVLEDSGRVPPLSLWNGIRVRVGIHFGSPLCEFDSVTRRTDYFGPMVNLTARIQGAAMGGQTLISSEVLEAINIDETPIPCVVSPGGTHFLKGIDAPIKLFSIIPTHLARRDADFEDQVRQKKEKGGEEGGPKRALDPLELVFATESLVTFVVVICQRLPELSEEQWDFSLRAVSDIIKHTADLSAGYMCKQSSTVSQIAFDNASNALRFSSQLQISCLAFEYGDAISSQTDYSTSSQGKHVLLYRGINPKIGVHSCLAQGELDAFSDRIIFQQSAGQSIVAALALNARQGETLVSRDLFHFIDRSVLAFAELPEPVMVLNSTPIRAAIVVPIDLEERIKMRPEFATEDYKLDLESDAAGVDCALPAGECLNCRQSLGPLCFNCANIDCSDCGQTFSVPTQCRWCSAKTGQHEFLGESRSGGLRRDGSSASLVRATGQRGSSRGAFSTRERPKPLVEFSASSYAAVSSPSRAESAGKSNRSFVGGGSSVHSQSAGDNSLARSRLQNALRHRQGGVGAPGAENLSAASPKVSQM